jgi:hypothetical protein
MEKKIYVCENCGITANSEKQLREENWITIHGGCLNGISVWLDKPRTIEKGVTDSYVIHIGYKDRIYHICSIRCLVKLLEGKVSI